MRIFIYEHLSAGDAPAAASLLTEGWAMLAALLEDFGRLPGVDVETMLGPAARAAGRTAPADVMVHPADEATFRRLAAAADWTLVVAPEIDGALPDRIRLVAESHGRLLGPSISAAELAGDKLRLACRLRECGVPTPPTVAWPAGPPAYPAVCKPRYGAGSQDIHMIHNPDEWRCGAGRDGTIVQPHVPGRAASVAFLTGPGRRLALPAAAQHLSADGRFRYLGGSAPLPPPLAGRAARLAERAVDAVEGLAGWVGVDVMLGATADVDSVIEVNPRLTTSYIGLRALAQFNLAAAMLAVAAGRAPPAWDWRPGPVAFTPDGAVGEPPGSPRRSG